jgi:hypothetical protein
VLDAHVSFTEPDGFNAEPLDAEWLCKVEYNLLFDLVFDSNFCFKSLRLWGVIRWLSVSGSVE